MNMRSVNMGMELDEREQLTWAEANTRSKTPLSRDDLQAIIAEHTEPADDGDPEWRKIPIADFGRADEMLGAFVSRCAALLDSGASENDGAPNLVGATQESLLIAANLQNAIADDFATR